MFMIVVHPLPRPRKVIEMDLGFQVFPRVDLIVVQCGPTREHLLV